MNTERRWKVIDESTKYFTVGEILELYRDDKDDIPRMKSVLSGKDFLVNTSQLVEIDEHVETIRTYKPGDTLDGGTLVKQEGEKVSKISNELVIDQFIDFIEHELDENEDCGRLSYKTLTSVSKAVQAEVQRLRDEREKVIDV